MRQKQRKLGTLELSINPRIYVVVLVSTPLQFSDADEIESADQRSVFLGKLYFRFPGKGIAAIEFTG